MKKIFLDEASPRLTEIFDDAQSGSPVLLVRGGEVAKLERLEPREFGGSIETLEKMLLEAVRGPHADWTAADLEDIAKRVREHRRGRVCAFGVPSGASGTWNITPLGTIERRVGN